MAEKTLDLFKETSFSTIFRNNLEQHHKISWMEDTVPPLAKSVFESITDMLKSKQNKNIGKNAFKICDLKGNFLIGAILSYHEAADENDPKGNWTLEFTFDADDMNGIPSIEDNLNSEYITTIANHFQSHCSRRFKSADYMHIVIGEMITTIKDYMMSNAPAVGSENPVFSVEIPDYCEIASTVENNEVVIAITPGAIIKQAIKDDTIV